MNSDSLECNVTRFIVGPCYKIYYLYMFYYMRCSIGFEGNTIYI